MRVPPPGLLKLDRDLLLKDVRARLAEAIPKYANPDYDPTDPGWLLLEQSAWLVELLSEQLDQYPFAVVRRFVHMMGGHLRPAHPAVGVLLCEVTDDGVMEQSDRRPSQYRFFTPQDEDMETVEFVPAESGVTLRRMKFQSMCEIAGDELFLVGPTGLASGLDAQAMWRSGRRRSRVFMREEIHYDAVTNNPDDLVEALTNAIKMLDEKRVGWLTLRIERVSAERIRLVARIDPSGAFTRLAPGGIWVGGDLEGDWGTLDGSTWTPVVTIAPHPMLPPHLHDQFPLPGFEEGQILLTDIPENFPVSQLLVRKASPTPEAVVEAVWTTLGNLDSRVGVIKPAVRVHFEPFADAGDLEPGWVGDALASGAWSRLARNQPKTVFHLVLPEATPKAGAEARIALVYELPHTTGALPKLEAIALTADGAVERTKVEAREAWRMPAPPAEGSHVMPTIVAYDMSLPKGTAGLLLASSGEPMAAMSNALMVINAPAVPDGRSVVVQRNIPQEYSLLFEDVVDRGVVDQLLEEPIPTNAAAMIRKLPLSWFPVADQDAVEDFAGLSLDASQGTMTVNAPDATGSYRTFRPGARLRIEWYRRTQGAKGNKPANSVRLVEQPANLLPKISAVTNPLGTFFGAERETPDAAIDRMFGPSEGTPVMAADYERLVRQTLGNRGRGWVVRCWTYAERALVSTAFWPFSDGEDEPDPEVQRVFAEMDGAGPETLLVALGPSDDVISDEDLDWARRAVRRTVERWSRRLPNIRRAVVTRFWPLVLTVPEGGEAPLLPTFEVGRMSGVLADVKGRIAHERPRAVLLLNAAVTEVLEVEQAEEVE